ncbi:MAG: 50S ribosomal protein L21 [Chloroflexi bacterium]|nr:50S ribosomal protein L21 [Chloroflexota bacterium]
MYAVVETGGKQYKVQVGQTIEVDKLPFAVGEKVSLDKVLLVATDKGVKVGNPNVEGAKVEATVTLQDAYRKILVFKYRPKKRYRRKLGHRQEFTRLRIDRIEA